MPTISTFYGIAVYFNQKEKEHNPPHIHARIGEYRAIFLLSNGELYEGKFPPRGTAMVAEFILENKQELEEMWETGNYYQLPPLK